MQVEVITGQSGSGKTTQLQTIQAELKHQGVTAPIIVGNCCTTPYFLMQLQRCAESGERHFLADDCTRLQIQAVMELRDNDNVQFPDDLIVHLVRQA